MLERLLSTLAKHLVSHTVTLSHMCEQMVENLSALEVGGTAGDTGFKLDYLIFETLVFPVTAIKVLLELVVIVNQI